MPQFGILTTPQIVKITSYQFSKKLHRIKVKRYNDLGISGIGDRRLSNQGAKALIDDMHQAHLWQALQENAPDGGLWNGRKVADWLSEVTGTKIIGLTHCTKRLSCV